MIRFHQEDLAKWNKRNFGEQPSENFALGMAEEVGELCHYILKRQQGIREGASGNDLKDEIADSFADAVIYGIALMDNEGLDAERVLEETIGKVLARDWKESKFRKEESNV